MEAGAVAADFAILRSWVIAAQEREIELRSEVTALKKNGETADSQLKALQDEKNRLIEELRALRMSRTYKVGVAFRDSRSGRGLFTLPVRLFRLFFAEGGGSK